MKVDLTVTLTKADVEEAIRDYVVKQGYQIAITYPNNPITIDSTFTARVLIDQPQPKITKKKKGK